MLLAIRTTQTNTVVSIWKGFDIIYQKNLGTSTVTKYFMAIDLGFEWRELLTDVSQCRL
jgi:hypothetical protein